MTDDKKWDAPPVVTGTRLDDAIGDLAVIADIATTEQIDQIADWIAAWREDIEKSNYLKPN